MKLSRTKSKGVVWGPRSGSKVGRPMACWSLGETEPGESIQLMCQRDGRAYLRGSLVLMGLEHMACDGLGRVTGREEPKRKDRMAGGLSVSQHGDQEAEIWERTEVETHFGNWKKVMGFEETLCVQGPLSFWLQPDDNQDDLVRVP